MRIAILSVTDRGRRLAEKIGRSITGSALIHPDQGVRSAMEQAWQRFDGLICIMAAGIAVRCIGGLCRSKFTDPCVVVVDEQGDFAVSLLSGHLGGGNELARRIARCCGGQAVITTASDISGHTSIDLWSVEHDCQPANPERLAGVAARLLNQGFLRVYQDGNFIDSLPADFRPCLDAGQADLIISLQAPPSSMSLHLVPRRRYIGFGCRKGASLAAFQDAIDDLRLRFELDLRSVAGIASIDIKAQEIGLRQIAERHRWPVRFFSKEALNSVTTPTKSAKVYEKTGAYSVCEAAALLAADRKDKPGSLLINKVKWKTITAAVAQRAD